MQRQVGKAKQERKPAGRQKYQNSINENIRILEH